MSTAPSETSGYDPLATSRQPAVGATTKVAAHLHQPTNLPLGVYDLALKFKDKTGTPIKGNGIPYSETPILFTIKFTNKPKDVQKMATTVIISELGKGGYRSGKSGKFFKNVRSTTFKRTVPIDFVGGEYSITIEVGHATAPSSGFHGPDGPYDVCLSFTPATGAQHVQEDMSAAAENDDDDVAVSQVEETLRYRFYIPKTHFMARLLYVVSRLWDGF
jgi:hypothetical protein